MKNKIVFLALSVIFLSSCQSSMNRFTQDERGGANTYSSVETGQLSSVLEGRIISIKPIKLSGSKVLDAAVAASAVGGERDTIPAAIVGGLLGAMAGWAIAENTTAEIGFEFLPKLSNGQIKAVVQKSQQGLRVGDQAYVIHGGQTARMTRK